PGESSGPGQQTTQGQQATQALGPAPALSGRTILSHGEVTPVCATERPLSCPQDGSSTSGLRPTVIVSGSACHGEEIGGKQGRSFPWPTAARPPGPGFRTQSCSVARLRRSSMVTIGTSPGLRWSTIDQRRSHATPSQQPVVQG